MASADAVGKRYYQIVFAASGKGSIYALTVGGLGIINLIYPAQLDNPVFIELVTRPHIESVALKGRAFWINENLVVHRQKSSLGANRGLVEWQEAIESVANPISELAQSVAQVEPPLLNTVTVLNSDSGEVLINHQLLPKAFFEYECPR